MPKYKIEKTNKFKKDYKRMKSQNNFDEKEFIKVIEFLSNDKKLPLKYHNHLLEPKSLRIVGMSYKT